ncbi:MAG TPA: P1 family peptidase, partial [bacterium]|nr:P1 family peptidase [bacterium]
MCQTPTGMVRVRDVLTLGILPPGPHNALTDVNGVRVGHASLVHGGLRTGVTAVLPHARNLYQEKVT